MEHEKLIDKLEGLTDEELSSYQFYAPWQVGPSAGEEGDALANQLAAVDRSNSSKYYQIIQRLLWEKFQENPWINTTVTDYKGRLTGKGFVTTSSEFSIREFVKKISNDIRNKLYDNVPKYVARQRIEGELYLCLTLDESGFVEIDFIDPGTVCGGDNDSGKFFHTTKPNFVLAYEIRGVASDGVTSIDRIIPSINIAHFPDMYKVLSNKMNFYPDKMNDARASSKKFKPIGGFKQFIIEWDAGLFTQRNVSSLRTTLEWINHYETLKKYEIDHKKAAGAYLWVITVNDPRAFRTWLGLSEEDRKKTGVMGKYAPGGKIILPPGMEMKAINPTLPNISGTDTDILHMVTAGLNSPEDMVTGQSGGTYASVKASRAPQSDRVSDALEDFEKFLRFTFWRSIFFLASTMRALPKQFRVEEAIEFKDGEPVYRKVVREPYELLEFTFPVSEVSDLEAVARAVLGVKHGSIIDTLGVPASTVARKLGIGSFHTARLKKATEDKMFPELATAVDQESAQEIATGETPKSGVKKSPKVVDKKGGTKEQTPSKE